MFFVSFNRKIVACTLATAIFRYKYSHNWFFPCFGICFSQVRMFFFIIKNRCFSTNQSSPLSLRGLEAYQDWCRQKRTDSLLLHFISFDSSETLLISLMRLHPLGPVPGKPWNTILSPATAPPGGSRISTLSGELAHMTMAWDTTPLILAGFRLQSRTAMRFCICTGTERRTFTALRKTELSHRALEFWFTWSRGMCLTSPLTTVLGEGSPTSTCSTYRLSASGCFSALIIRPTRRSSRDTSTLESSWLGVACFFSALSPPYAQERSVSLDLDVLNLYLIYLKKTGSGEEKRMGTILDTCLKSDWIFL